MENHYDVLIAGAGPTGLTLANLFGRAGVRTLLVEANASTVSEPRAVSIDDESLRAVQKMDLLDQVLPDTVAGYGSEYRSPNGRIFLRVKPLAKPYGHPRRNAFRQPLFEARLREGLARYPSVETRFQCKVMDFIQDKTGVSVDLLGGDGQAATATAAYMIGCDGAGSPTRGKLGSTLEGDSLAERWLIVDLENSPSPSPETIVFCDPERACIALPGPHLTRRYEFKLKPGETDAAILADETVERLLDRHDADPHSRIVRKTVYHFHARIADNWGRGRVFLAGDAAHLMPPFAGQGMNSGVRDAVNLAWKLEAVVKGRIGAGLLASYEVERRQHVAEMIRLAVRMGGIMGPRTKTQGFATRLFFSALAVWPAARSYFAEMKYKPAPRFDHGFFLREPDARKSAVGRMIRQPVIDDLGVKRPLDDVLGDDFALVVLGLTDEVLQSIELGREWDGLVARRLALPAPMAQRFGLDSGTILLVRPDRYVIAAFALSELPTVRAGLERLMHATRP